MEIVPQEDALNIFLRRFAPRYTVRLSPDLVEVTSQTGLVRATPVVTLVDDKGRLHVGSIGDEPIAGNNGVRFRIFEHSATHGGHTQEELIAAFFRVALSRVLKKSLIRPVIIVENLDSLEAVMGGRQREVISHSIEQASAVALVIRPRIERGIDGRKSKDKT